MTVLSFAKTAHRCDPQIFRLNAIRRDFIE
jgi:hypothetical protein